MLQRIVDGVKERTPPMARAPRQAVYMKNAYVALLLRHYKECGLPEPDWLDEIPESPTLNDVEVTVKSEPVIHFSDDIVLTLTCDEEAGKVTVNMSPAMADLYRTSYARGEQPSIESLVRVYKQLGYSDKYLMDMLKKHDRNVQRIKKVDLDKIFKADSGSKTKRVKKKDEPMVEELETMDDANDEEEDDVPVEDAFDMEIDDDDEDLQGDDDDEEYISE